MLDKFVLIGLGGSGGATVRYTVDSLRRNLERVGEHELPDAWQFMQIDAPISPDGPADDIPADVLSRVSYTPLGTKNGKYIDLDGVIASDPDLVSRTAGWRPDPQDPNVKLVLPGQGAGQMRAVGRVIGLTSNATIRRAIEEAIVRLKSPSSETQLASLSQNIAKAYGEVDKRESVTRIIIVTSWGGGAGSGLFTDVLEMIRAQSLKYPGLMNNLAVVAYMPDVSDLSDGNTRGVGPNSFAAMSEYMNLFERTLSDGDGGLADQNVPPRLLMIGSSDASANVKLTSDRQVYRYIGGALANIFTDAGQLEFISSYLFQNPTDEPYLDSFPFGPRNSSRAAKSFGSSSVKLGHNGFERFVSELIASEVLRRLLDGHNPDQKNLPTDMILAELLDKHFDDFARLSGLRELDPANDVLEGLSPRAQRPEIERGWKAGLESIRSKLQGDVPNQSKSDWIKVTDALFADLLSRQRVEQQQNVGASAASWSANAQACFLNALVERAAFAHGLEFALVAIDKLASDSKEAAAEMRRDQGKARDGAARASREARSVLESLPEKREIDLLATPEWEDWCSSRLSELKMERQIVLFETAERILLHLEDGLFGPVRTRMREMMSQLALNRNEPVVKQWALTVDSDVPNHLIPPINERYLIDTKEWSSYAKSLFADVFSEYDLGKLTTWNSIRGQGFETHFGKAVKEVLTGLFWDQALDASAEKALGGRPADKNWPSRPGSTTAIRRDNEGDSQSVPATDFFGAIRGSWVPPVGGSQAASIVFEPVGAEKNLAFELKERAARWLREREGAFSRHLTMNIRGWLETDTSNRSMHLANEIAAAIDLSQPLLNVSNSTYVAIHGSPNSEASTGLETRNSIGKIPLSANNHAQAYEAVTNALERAGYSSNDIKSSFSEGASRDSIELTTFTLGTFHPIVAESLMGPVRDAWSRSSGSKRDFLLNRRAQQMPDFLPLPSDKLQDMIRGIVSAWVLGYLATDISATRTWAEGPLGIWTPDGVRRFPADLLEFDPLDVNSGLRVIVALMASFPVSFIDLSAGLTESRDAYARLIKLGEQRNNELATWIIEGLLPSPTGESGVVASTPLAEWAGTSSSTPDERKEVVSASVIATQKALQALSNEKLDQRTNTLFPGVDWEMRGVLSSAITELAGRIDEIGTQSSGSGLLG